MRSATLRKIDRLRKKLIGSIEDLRHQPDPDAQALALLHEFTVDALNRLPQLVVSQTGGADAVILTQAQHRELLLRFALDVLALQTGGLVRGSRRNK